MAVSREQVFSAIFALTNGILWDMGTPQTPDLRGFKVRERKIRLFSDVNSKTEMPYIAQTEHGETFIKQTRTPYKRVWNANWVVYHSVGNQPGQTPSICNNMILDAIEVALAPKPNDPGFLDERNTLSGLVHHCYIDGEVFKDPGDIDGIGLLSIPIKILVP